MKTFKMKLLKKQEIAFKTTAFYFSRPEKLNFYAGQYGKITLINPQKTDIKGNTRSYSLANHPSEPEIMIATRMRNSAFKNVLDSLPKDSEVELQAPIQMFQLPKTQKPLVFLTGGIGVAAARPMIIDALEQHWMSPIYLFNANRNQKDIPFFEEFKKLAHLTFSYIPVLSKKSKEDQTWTGERGYINAEMLQKYVQEPTKAIYYLIGPPAFMWGMYKILQQFQIKDSQINFDEFTGY